MKKPGEAQKSTKKLLNVFQFFSYFFSVHLSWPLGVFICSNLALFEKSLDTPGLEGECKW